MQHKTPPRLDRAAIMYRTIGCNAGLDPDVGQQLAKAKALAQVTNTDTKRAVRVMNAHGDNGAVEARIAHAGHRQHHATGKILRLKLRGVGHRR
jgi:hypothetical protein